MGWFTNSYIQILCLIFMIIQSADVEITHHIIIKLQTHFGKVMISEQAMNKNMKQAVIIK